MYQSRRFSSAEEIARTSQDHWIQNTNNIRPSSLSPTRDLIRDTLQLPLADERNPDRRALSVPYMAQAIGNGGVIIEELEDGQDMGYDADIEVRQPDEYDEAESDSGTPVSLFGTLPLNEANLAEHFRRLNCNVNQAMTFEGGQANIGGFPRPIGVSRKRRRSESIESMSDHINGAFVDVRPKRRRQIRKVEDARHRSSSVDGLNASTSPLEYSPEAIRSLDRITTPLDYEREQPSLQALMERGDDMDIDGD